MPISSRLHPLRLPSSHGVDHHLPGHALEGFLPVGPVHVWSPAENKAKAERPSKNNPVGVVELLGIVSCQWLPVNHQSAPVIVGAAIADHHHGRIRLESKLTEVVGNAEAPQHHTVVRSPPDRGNVGLGAQKVEQGTGQGGIIRDIQQVGGAAVQTHQLPNLVRSQTHFTEHLLVHLSQCLRLLDSLGPPGPRPGGEGLHQVLCSLQLPGHLRALGSGAALLLEHRLEHLHLRPKGHEDNLGLLRSQLIDLRLCLHLLDTIRKSQGT
mmetsp:Transcript_7455/g.16747  ORF Transcript_7455/g.16747 Transcript_7455/m.16747 type:complete len:267 (-) Transcript_7455:4-804(-)